MSGQILSELEVSHLNLSERYDRLKKHSVNQRKELRRLNRQAEASARMGSSARNVLHRLRLTAERDELKKKVQVLSVLAGGFGACFVVYTVSVWGYLLV